MGIFDDLDADGPVDVPIASSAIASCTYDPASQIMTLGFTDGTEHDYQVTPDIVEDLATAASPGAYFNSYIRGVFEA